MDFLLSMNGLIYNVPALVALGLALWRRPYFGIIMSGIACLRVWGPILGYEQMISGSVHMMLGVSLAGAWRQGRPLENILLSICGGALVAFTFCTYGWLLPATEEVWAGFRTGALMGEAIAFLELTFCLIKEINAYQREGTAGRKDTTTL